MSEDRMNVLKNNLSCLHECFSVCSPSAHQINFPYLYVFPCLDRPTIFLDPPVPSGVLTVEANRRTNLRCAVDDSNNPLVMTLMSGGE